jgi:hypothetical protein
MKQKTWFCAVLVTSIAWSVVADACPFCSAVSQTFTEEMQSMDVAVIATLLEAPKPLTPDAAPSEEVPKARFQVKSVVKGESFVKVGQTIETIYFGTGQKGTPFLVMAVEPPKLAWSTPLQLTERAEKYVGTLLTLPAKGATRLEFFQKHLEDKDEMLARDSYDEFAKAPYEDVIALKSKMNHEQLVTWIRSRDVPASRRRLYLTMLGVCGGPQDIPMLEQLLKSSDKLDKAGLDAMIGCYLTLRGADGMPLIEDLFLRNPMAEYADTYAAIMALRFHGSETDVIPRARVLQGLRCLLSRPSLADLVIADLARWEDWSAMDRLVELFKNADEKSSWVRVPVINYLRACPLPEAEKHLVELEKIDPAAVKRANTFFPFGGGSPAPSSPPSSPSPTTPANPATTTTAPTPAVTPTSAAATAAP